MRRRSAGVVLVVAALCTAVLLPNSNFWLISGLAQPIPIPAPPQVADCLTRPLPAFFNVNDSSQGQYSYSQLPMGPCSGLRYGEIVWVSTDAAAGTADPSSGPCDPFALSYLGLPVVQGKPSPVFSFWYPSTSTASFLVGPSERQRSAGQNWSACVLYLPSGDPGMMSEPYRGTLRNAAFTGTANGLVGVCPDNDSWNGSVPGACGIPHQAEVFATNYFMGNQTVSRAHLLQTCRDLVQQATGTADLTTNGALEVRIAASSPDGYPVTGPDIPASAYVKCGIQVVGNRQLTGSLLALRGKPLPLR